ncbi:hypothetical protein GTN31_07240 [Macrococcoides canis]|uniref:SMI1/KNR4 family protein n=1 Tax=Macrococcoides canis TaxID=1855823 RepID=UPI0013E999CD|nr:SMI1/KNR4 family protein [Macrococcus canis]QIH76153.1 hypothetical protein GTN31_07240 [Macrococcus canis]
MNFDSLIVKGSELNLQDIKSFEKWRGYKLPNDFVEFTLKYPFAHMSAEFDAEGRPDSMISNMLRFSKEGYSSIYVDEAYDIKDFGPFVLFGEDPGGNYLAFDYSKSDSNPSVVFIDHEKLGIIELPEGTSENDFTEEEMDKMMNSEKLEDFPWAIHYVADSFTKFVSLLRFNKKKKYSNQIEPFDKQRYKKILEESNKNFPKSILKFIENYGGQSIKYGKFQIFNQNIEIVYTINFNEKSNWDYYNYLNKYGGIKKYTNLLPILIVCYQEDIIETSLVAILNENDKYSIVIIPKDVIRNDKKSIAYDELIYVTDDVDLFIKKLIIFFES